MVNLLIQSHWIDEYMFVCTNFSIRLEGSTNKFNFVTSFQIMCFKMVKQVTTSEEVAVVYLELYEKRCKAMRNTFLAYLSITYHCFCANFITFQFSVCVRPKQSFWWNHVLPSIKPFFVTNNMLLVFNKTISVVKISIGRTSSMHLNLYYEHL